MYYKPVTNFVLCDKTLYDPIQDITIFICLFFIYIE